MVQGIVDVMEKYAPIIANQNLKPKALAGLLDQIKTDTTFNGIMAGNGMGAANEVYSPGQIGNDVFSTFTGDPYQIIYNLEVTGGLNTGAEVGQAVINAIRSYNRAAGPANIQVA